MANPSPNISPVLADLSQDIAGMIPLELILLWNTGDKTEIRQKELLTPHLKKGIVVSSDSAGLSKLSASKHLMEVMQLVSEPKEVIYGYGKSVGGEAIGMWVADNTQMFYDQSIKPEEVIDAMVAAQQEIADLIVQVGMGIHQGTFMEIGGGLYGGDAQFIEELAENQTEGGEIVLTHSVTKQLSDTYQSYLSPHTQDERAAILNYADLNPLVSKHQETQYPYPFNTEFFEVLKLYSQLSKAEQEKKYQSFSQQTTVVLVKVLHEEAGLLLDQLTRYIVANAYINQVLKDFPHVTVVKSNGDLGIFVTNEPTEAVSFAQHVREKLQKNGFIVNIGVTSGEVLLFPLQKGYEIAGGPVNVASKLAEDSGENGKIFVESSVKIQVPEGKPFSFEISKVQITGKSF